MAIASKPRLGLVFDEDGLVLTLRLAQTQSIDQARYFAYTEEVNAQLESKVHFAATILRKHFPQYSDYDLWTYLEPNEVNVLKVPTVGEAELDSVVQLHANKQMKFDPQTMVMDYRVLERGAEQTIVLVLTVYQEALDTFVKIFEANGLSLKGITSLKLAATAAFNSEIEQIHWQTYAIWAVEAEVSYLTIIKQGVPVLVRSFNYGNKQLFGDVAEHLTLNLSAEDLTTSLHEHTVLNEVKRLFNSDELIESEREIINKTIEPNLERAVQYLERTFNYYDRVEHGDIPEGVYLVADKGVGGVLGHAFEEAIGLPCQVAYSSIKMSPQAKEVIQQLRDELKNASVLEGLALVVAPKTIPNLLDLPSSRRQLGQIQKILTIARQVTLGLCGMALIACAVLAVLWFGVSSELTQKQNQLDQIKEPLTAQSLVRETQALARLQAQAREVAQHQRFAAILGQLGQWQNDRLYFTDIRLGRVPATARQRDRNATQNAGEEELLIQLLLMGNAQQRESTLADLINQIKAVHPGNKIQVVAGRADLRGVSYDIRITGGF